VLPSYWRTFFDAVPCQVSFQLFAFALAAITNPLTFHSKERRAQLVLLYLQNYGLTFALIVLSAGEGPPSQGDFGLGVKRVDSSFRSALLGTVN
jgi:hypothetical protein